MRSLPEVFIFMSVQFLFGTVGAQVLPAAARDTHPWLVRVPYPAEHILRPIDGYQTPESQLTRAIARSAKKGFIENGVEESTKALIDCQKETSNTLTMPFGRGDSQQAHCYRY